MTDQSISGTSNSDTDLEALTYLLLTNGILLNSLSTSD